jgi:replicative DNA helicase
MAARLRKARPPRDPEAIPLELRSIPRWVVWDFFQPKPGKTKLGKVPLDPDRDSMADYTNPAAWRSFDDVLAEARRRGDVGVGFVFADSDDVVGVDLDDAYLPSGELKPWAKEILDRLAGTWAEKSVSGSGVHALGRGDRIVGKKRLDLSPSEGIERYSENRFFTVSGDVLQAAPLADVREAMAWLETRHFRPAPTEREKAIREANRDAAGPRPADPELDRELARVCLGHLKDARAHDGDDWRRVGAALKATAEDLLDDWVAFSKRWPECSEEECSDRWRRLVPHSERPATLGSLVHMAGEDSGRSAVDLVREAKARLGRDPGSTGPAPAPKKTAEELDREERLEAARYGVEASGVLCLVLASDPTLALYRETGLGRAGDVVAVPELNRQDWSRIAKAFPGARVQLVAGDLGEEAFRGSCRSLLETRSAPEGVVVVGPEVWQGEDDLPGWLDVHGLSDPSLVLAERGRPAALWIADDLLGSISPASDDALRREAVDRVLDAVTVCRGPRAALDVEDLLARAGAATGYSREALEGLISKARERAESNRLRDRLGKELERLAASAGDEKIAGESLLERARGLVEDLTTRSAVVPLPPPFDVAAVEAEARLVRPGFSTGWADLDRGRVRLRPKELVGVAARPGQGKTSVLVWFLWKLLEQVDEGAVVFVSHEETKISLLHRLFALASAVLEPEEKLISQYRRHSRRWNRGDVRDWLAGGDDGQGVPKAKVELLDRARELVVERTRRLIVIEERSAGADRVAKLCRAIHDAHGCRGVLVDYLQRLPHDGDDLPKGRRDMETAWACRRLREGIAIPFDCPVVVAAQVNREALRDGWGRRLLEALDPSKKSKRGRGGSGEDDGPDVYLQRVERVLAEARPAPHHLRDGGIEHEADLILGTHNPSADMAWDKEKRRAFVDLCWPRNETPLDVGILKNRSGSDGDWVRLVGDYGAGYFASESEPEEAEEGVGAVPLDEWAAESNPFDV